MQILQVLISSYKAASNTSSAGVNLLNKPSYNARSSGVKNITPELLTKKLVQV